MKKSFYNFQFPSESGKCILYNTRTGALAELDEEHTKKYNEYPLEILQSEMPQFIEALSANGYVVADEVCEQDIIRYQSLQYRFGLHSYNVTLAPTLGCNFACIYCYEKNRQTRHTMDAATKEAVFEYIKRRILPEGALNLTWYGGEPLLALDTVLELSAKLSEVCKEKKAGNSFSMITNGYLLTQETAKKLVEVGIREFQITLDGDEQTHNSRRALINGEESYRKIWDNLLTLKTFRKEIKVLLRVNVDKKNYQAVVELSNKIKEQQLSDFIIVYPGKVIDEGKCYQKETCFDNQEFAALEQQYFCDNQYLLPNVYPSPRHIFCIADSDRSIIIDPDGNLYKCTMEIGDAKYAIGNVANKNQKYSPHLFSYLLQDNLKEDCLACKYYPICLGGCPHARLEGSTDCSAMRYALEKYMEYFPDAMRAAKKAREEKADKLRKEES